MAKEAANVISMREEIAGPRGLDDRIADAFGAAMTSTAIAQLLREVQEASTAAQAEAKAADERALDPKLRPAEVADFRKQAEDANFRAKRLDAAAEQLTGLRDQAKAKEDAEARRIAHEAAIVERDQLVKDLQAYEGHALCIAELLKRIDACNQKLPIDSWPERIARGADPLWNVQADGTLPGLLSAVRLPKFRRDGSLDGYLWPTIR